MKIMNIIGNHEDHEYHNEQAVGDYAHYAAGRIRENSPYRLGRDANQRLRRVIGVVRIVRIVRMPTGREQSSCPGKQLPDLILIVLLVPQDLVCRCRDQQCSQGEDCTTCQGGRQDCHA